MQQVSDGGARIERSHQARALLVRPGTDSAKGDGSSLMGKQQSRQTSFALCVLLVAALVSACGDEEQPAPRCAGDEMVHMNAPALGIDFYIDKYEASRADASADSAGSYEKLACSVPAALPWAQVTHEMAKQACEAVGKRLCTEEEWRAACGSLGANYAYPYAANYDASRCNGDDGSGNTSLAPTASFDTCLSLQKVFDLSGNVREWTSDGDAGPALMGGGFGSGKFDLSCEVPFRPTEGVNYEPGTGDGFRCCRSSAP
ncbi:MAG: SUMF1/EgtB/PvdO family nonheme iron enzyme [Myxococcota bacterium]|nr:SUMF1/EgtB/PvdO family nonheme iron enzyme [Myxococcota bacterium]